MMEELSKIAMAHYQASSDHLQKLAGDFFTVMDHDGDGKIDQREFLEFMREEGYGQMTNPSFFKKLDLDGNGTLDFAEVMTLYYIVKSGRPFCDNCKNFIPGTYFTCVGCLEDALGGTFHLCLDCYINQRCDHTHKDLSQFLDNYSLLVAKTKPSPNLQSPSFGATSSEPSSLAMVSLTDTRPPVYSSTWKPSAPLIPVPDRSPPTYNNAQQPFAPAVPVLDRFPSTIHHHTWIQNNYTYYPPPPIQHTTTSTALVPQRQQWKIALQTLNAAINIASVGSLCSIL